MTTIKKLVPDYIFEASWEVCNKVGGIYTVLSTRANVLQTQFEDKIIFIGPDLWKGKDKLDFIENPSLFNSWKEYAGSKENLHVRVGRWNVHGKPVVILVDFQTCLGQKNDLYSSMWQQFGVDSLHAYGDYDESCIFAYAASLVIESFYTFFDLRKKKVVAHFNEWMLGMGALYIRSNIPAIATLFTTHATSIGRSIAGNGKPLYAHLNNYSGDQMAQELNMEAKHSIEKQAAWHVDCFTTVSDITAKECEQLLSKKPDIVTPNGFGFDVVPPPHTYIANRKKARERLIDVAEKLIGKAIRKDAFLISTSGRYEYRNKGIDVFIAAIDKLRQYTFEKDIIAFILVPGWIKGPRKDLRDRLAWTKQLPVESLLNPYITHELYEPFSDKVSTYLNHLQFINSKDQKVNLIFVPSYLMGDDGIFDLPYYDLLTGMDLTVYPSYYEPWGYTPLESIAFSIPTITTDLAGFGLWARQGKDVNEGINSGIEVIERTDDNYLEIIEKIASVIANYIVQSPGTINRSRKAAFKRSEYASWDHFIVYYLEAYHIALQQAKKRKNKY
jgi:glycogen synthase